MSSLTNEHVCRFERDGFVVFDDIFNAREISAFKTVLGRVIRSSINRVSARMPGGFPAIASGDEVDQGLIGLANADRGVFDEIYDTIWQMPEFLRLVSKPVIERIANRLMDRDPVAPIYGFINRCRITLPGDEYSQTGWHQEIFQTVPGARFIQIWAPLVHAATPEMGPVTFCAGSHRVPMPKPSWRENANGVSKIIFDKTLADQFEQVSMTLKLGQAVFFDGKLLHGSRPNVSGQVRYSMVGLFHDVEDSNFVPLKWRFNYRDRSPKDYFDSLPDVY